MNMQQPLVRGVLVLEIVAAFACPCYFLILGTIFSFVGIGSLFAQGEFWGLLWVALVAGGYMGMIGVLDQTCNLLAEQNAPLKWKPFVYTSIGCFAIAPFTYLMVMSGDFLAIIAGLAPIVVAIQLTFMNRKDLLGLIESLRSN